MSHAVLGRATVGAQLGERLARRRLLRAHGVDGLVGHRLERRTRKMCSRPEPRVRPTIVPRAYGSQCGEPRPVSAGTK